MTSANLDIKNPNAKQDFEHLPPEQLADDILKKEQRISELMGEIKAILAASPEDGSPAGRASAANEEPTLVSRAVEAHNRGRGSR